MVLSIRRAACGVAILLSLRFLSLPAIGIQAGLNARSAVSAGTHASTYYDDISEAPGVEETNNTTATIPEDSSSNSGGSNITSVTVLEICTKNSCVSDTDCGPVPGCVCHGSGENGGNGGSCGPPLFPKPSTTSYMPEATPSIPASPSSFSTSSFSSYSSPSSTSTSNPSTINSPHAPYSRKPLTIESSSSSKGSCPNIKCQTSQDCGSICSCIRADSSGDVPIGQCVDPSFQALNATGSAVSSVSISISINSSSSSTASVASASPNPRVQPTYSGLPHFGSK
jgi:hypothetical protein